MGFSQHYFEIIQKLRRRTNFFCQRWFWNFADQRQSSGIRQGCPLSRYLFVIAMPCVDIEIRLNSSRRVQNGRIPNLDFDMLYYADDTILFSTDNRALNELLKLAETISTKHGLRLNKDKCVVIQMNNDGMVHFESNEPLPKQFEAAYLGKGINKEANIQHEILNKMQEVRKTWYKLLSYWKATNANVKWQLIIFDVVIRSKMLYGLNNPFDGCYVKEN